MMNNLFKPSVNRNTTYSPYFVNRPIPENAIKANYNHKYRKYKLIALILAKAAQRELKDTWEKILAPQKKLTVCLSKVISYSEKNLVLTMYLSFDRLKKAAVAHRSGDKMIKGMVTLLRRMEMYKLKQSFGRLVLYVSRQNDKMINTFYMRRDQNFGCRIQTLFKRHKKEGFMDMRRYAKFVKSFSKVRVISVIQKRYERSIKQTVFTRLSRLLLSKLNNTNIDRQMKDLKVQIQDMQVQLQNKKENIQRLQGQLSTIKIQQSSMSINHNLTYGEQTHRSKRDSFRSTSMKKILRNNSQNRSFNNQSGDMLINDTSIGSLLGNLNKSRYSGSKFDASGDCNCGFKSRYHKYKSVSESLKNQLEIVKEELEVAKDLNEHFTNEINQYLTEGNEGDVQQLKKENRLVLEERDQLRDKVFKYQKQIAHLKSQFKFKMEELYRKVRKGGI